MAIASARDHGLFINGEAVGPASGELRDLIEPASGEPLARAALASRPRSHKSTKGVLFATSPKPFNPFGL